MVVAPLADPVACPLMCPLRVRILEQLLAIFVEFERRFQSGVGRSWLVLCFGRVDLESLESHGLLVLVKLEGRLLGVRLDEVRWLASQVFGGLRLLAAVALLSPFEIVVLAFRALPTSLWELEVPFRFLVWCLFAQFVWRYFRRRRAHLRR